MAVRLPISLSPLSNFANLIDNAFYDIPFVSNPTKKMSAKQPANAVLGSTTKRSAPAPSGGVVTNFTPSDDGYVAGTTTGGGGYAPSAEEQAAAAAKVMHDANVGKLRGEISGRGGELDALYNAIFGDVDALLRDRDSKIESDYGEQFKKTADQYASSIPTIENSYAAIGSGDSTDNSDAKDSAKHGFDDTNVTIGKNKASDKAKLGQYGNEQKARFGADRDAVKRNVTRAAETDDEDALRGMRNDLETKSGEANVARATLGTDGKARQDLAALTADGGRFQAAQNALDSIIKGSMSGSVKEAAVKSIVDNAGLSDDEKKKIDLQFGNVYNEQNLA